MPPESESETLLSSAGSSNSENEDTQVFENDDQATYIVCKSKKPYVNPTVPVGTKPEDVMKKLNLDLGQKFVNAESKIVVWIIRFLSSVAVEWWEFLFFKFWKAIPLSFRRALTFYGWKIYFKLHKTILGRKTGVHPSQSPEYHALTSIMWWGRLFPISPERMRFSLSQLYVCTPNVVEAYKVETIEQQMPFNVKSEEEIIIPPCQQRHKTVRGMFLHQGKEPTEHIIFWIYGGAYLAGDVLGNSSSADWVAKQTKMDVFVPDFRLAPDGDMDDVLWDVALAYKWLLDKTGKDASQIFFLGISSGGAVCVRLMQLMVEQQNGDKKTMPEYIPKLGAPPKGAVLFGPYVDYTEEKKGSFLHYPRMDLVVNEAVQRDGLPYLEKFIPDGKRKEYSPVHRSMKGLPPLCVVVSEHEAVYDMTMEVVNQARKDGVSVTVGIWKYMCHVFTFFWGFIPEGKQSMDFACNWIREEAAAGQQ
mmetsp:Transcript_20222/g.49598  ORF Transcript_20222/g.49598 Transcript_20222/m.49598 type:complete len:475 (+) Transcript_20222:69-1493(+)